MKLYQGSRTARGAEVFIVEDGTMRPLPPRLDLRDHSPGGRLCWGYYGSCPAQLALAMLCDCLGDDERALDIYQEYKTAVVAQLRYDGWVLTEEEVRGVVNDLELERKPS